MKDAIASNFWNILQIFNKNTESVVKAANAESLT